MVHIWGNYADDITLSCPSVYGLNKTMNICCDFAINNFITFNAQKLICIKNGNCKTNRTCYIKWQYYIKAHWR